MTPASLETGTGSVAHEGLFPAQTYEQGSPEQEPRGDSGDIRCGPKQCNLRISTSSPV